MDQTVDISGASTPQSVITNMRLHLDDCRKGIQGALNIVQQQLTKLTTAMSTDQGQSSDEVGLTTELATEISGTLQDVRVKLTLSASSTQKAGDAFDGI